MVAEIRLPPLGQTSDEMTVVEWYKKEGDAVEIAEPLLCVETDKSNVDVESAEEGVLLKIVAREGDVLASGSLLAYVGSAGDVIEAPAAVAASATPGAGPVLASPLVRKLAKDLGVDLATVTGTGPGGRIERADVQGAAAPAEPVVAAVGAPAAVDDAAVSPLRRTIARRLTASVRDIPAFSLEADLDATGAKEALAGYGKGLTYTHLLLRAVARSLREHPVMRRLWVDDGPRYRSLAEPDVGLAVAGDDSLYVVTIPAPDALTLPALIETVAAAAGRGRSGALNAADQRPATITVSNLGGYGVRSFQAVIDPDQNAIVAAGAVTDQVVAHDGMIAVRPRLAITLSCDHRAVDGAQAAAFLRTLAAHFETDPAGPGA